MPMVAEIVGILVSKFPRRTLVPWISVCVAAIIVWQGQRYLTDYDALNDAAWQVCNRPPRSVIRNSNWPSFLCPTRVLCSCTYLSYFTYRTYFSHLTWPTSIMSRTEHASAISRDAHTSVISSTEHTSVISRDAHSSVISRSEHNSVISCDANISATSCDAHQLCHVPNMSRSSHVTHIHQLSHVPHILHVSHVMHILHVSHVTHILPSLYRPSISLNYASYQVDTRLQSRRGSLRSFGSSGK